MNPADGNFGLWSLVIVNAICFAGFAGLLLASPMVMTQVWLFIAPGLYAHEKRFAIPNNFPKKPELSADFIHAMIEMYGGAEKFFHKFFLDNQF